MFKRKENKAKQEITEEEAIRLAKQDHRYFGVLYEAHFAVIFRFVYQRLGGKEEIAGDLTQQTFFQAMTKIHQYEDRGGAFRSWLFRIAQNEVNQFFRKEKRNTEVEIQATMLVDLMDEATIKHEQEADFERIVSYVNDLESEQQNLIELRFFQGLSFKEIAEIYHLTEANTKMRVYRILEKLKTKWRAENENV